MPFIRGRYYANPIVGGAIEAAREAEDVAAGNNEAEALEHEREDDQGSKPASRIEIEVAELVPVHSGQAERGYVARLHYPDPDGVANADQPGEKHVFSSPEQLVSFLRSELAKSGAGR